MGNIRVDLLLFNTVDFDLLAHDGNHVNPHREINCNGSVKEELFCVLSASLSDRGSGVLHLHSSMSTWRSHAFGLGVNGCR